MNGITKKLSFLILTASVLISGCSSDSGSSGITNATITDDNSVDLATAGTEGVKQAVSNDSYNPFAAAKTANPSLAQTLTVSVAEQASQDPSFATTNFCETGSVIGFDTLGENGGTITYDKCVIGGATIDGTMVVITKSAGDTYTYTITADITITYLSEVESFDYSATCTFNQTSGAASCTYNSAALGIDDRKYSVSNISVDGNGISGYTVSATVTDPDHGNITISTNKPVTFNNCPNGQPDSGEIVVSDGTRSMTVTFNDCDSFSINFNGSTTTHNW